MCWAFVTFSLSSGCFLVAGALFSRCRCIVEEPRVSSWPSVSDLPQWLPLGLLGPASLRGPWKSSCSFPVAPSRPCCRSGGSPATSPFPDGSETRNIPLALSKGVMTRFFERTRQEQKQQRFPGGAGKLHYQPLSI